MFLNSQVPSAPIASYQAKVDSICCRLRARVKECYQLRLYSSAVFFADKVLYLRNPSSLMVDDTINDQQYCDDFYTLCECYWKNGEHLKVLRLLQSSHSCQQPTDDRLKLMSVQCLLECNELDQCLAFLDDHVSIEDVACSDKHMAGAFAFLRGNVYELLENQENALAWYHKAVEYDPYLHQALERLLGSHVLPLEKELELLQALKFHADDEWLRHMYSLRASHQSCDVTGGDGAFDDAFQCFTVAAAKTSVAQCSSPAASAPCAPLRLMDHSSGTLTVCKGSVSVPLSASLLPFCLSHSEYTITSQAIKLYYDGNFEGCYHASRTVLATDPFAMAILPVHIASLVQLNRTNAIFYIAHQLVDAYPHRAVAWFAAGCYYFAIKKYQHARRLFSKCLALEPFFAPAWVAYGHSFAFHDESDQALSAYRTVSRLFVASHLPWLFTGIEYLRTNSLGLASQCLDFAFGLAPGDPQVLNELGVVAFQKRKYDDAIGFFSHAVRICSTSSIRRRQLKIYYCNLGHALAKCWMSNDAVVAFRRAADLSQGSADAGCLLGVAYVHHLCRDYHGAIEYYHRVLCVDRANRFAQDMLQIAVDDSLGRISCCN